MRKPKTDVSNILEADAKLITDYLFKEYSDNYYEVPFYQRPYSWEASECRRLFEDIMEADELFLGSTILCPKEADSSNKVGFEIVDGQQRIISLTILASALRYYINENILDEFKDSISDSEKSSILSLKDDIINRFLQIGVKSYHTDPNNPIDYNSNAIYKLQFNHTQNINKDNFFEIRVLKDYKKRVDATKDLPTLKTVKDTNPEQHRVWNNFNNFYSYIRSWIAENTDEKDSNNPIKLMEKVHLIFEEISNLYLVNLKIKKPDDAINIFERINSTGLDLNLSDLLKGLIMKRVFAEAKEKDQASLKLDEINESWTNLSHKVTQNLKLKMPKFLRYYWLANEEFKMMKEIYASLQEKYTSADSCERLLEDLHKTADILIDIWPDWSERRIPLHDNDRNYSLNPHTKEKMANSIFAMHILDVDQFLVLVIAILGGIKNNDDMQEWLATPNNNRKTRNEKYMISLFQALEDFLFYYYKATQGRAVNVEKSFNRWALEFKTIVETRDHNQRRDKFKKFVKKIIYGGEINGFSVQGLRYSENGPKRLLPSKNNFKDGFNNSIFYNERNTSIIRYVLCKINEYVEEHEFGDQDATNWYEIYKQKNRNIDHIFPQKRPDSEHRNDFPETFKQHETISNSYMHQLGNLTLFGLKGNSGKGNLPPTHPKVIEKLSSDTALPITKKTLIPVLWELVKNKKEWLSEQILERNEIFSNYAIEIWWNEKNRQIFDFEDN